MKSHQHLSRHQLVSWSFAVLLAAVAGIIPWQIVPQAAFAQEPQEVTPSPRIAEARLKLAQAKQKVAEDQLTQAEAEVEHASKEMQFRRSELNRMHELVKKRAIEPGILEEEELRFRSSEAAEQVAKAKRADMRAAREAARAAVQEAEALRDISRLGNDREIDLRKARNRLHEARYDLARYETEAARAAVQEAEANVEKTRTQVVYRTSALTRLQRYADQQLIEPKLIDEAKQQLDSSRKAQQEAEAIVRHARAV